MKRVLFLSICVVIAMVLLILVWNDNILHDSINKEDNNIIHIEEKKDELNYKIEETEELDEKLDKTEDENEYEYGSQSIVVSDNFYYNPNAPEYSLNETFIQDDWEYCVKSCVATKKQGDWPVPDGFYEVDKNGNIKNGLTFILVTYSLKRVKDSKEFDDYWINANTLFALDRNDQYIYTDEVTDEVVSSTAISKDSFKNKVKQCYRQSMKVGDEMEITNVYVTCDAQYAVNGCFMLSVSHGSQLVEDLLPDQHCYVRLYPKKE